MNCGMPTESAARRPWPSRIVALRSFDWLRIGVVAVRDTYVAISKQMVSIAPRTTSAVTGSTVGRVAQASAALGQLDEIDVSWSPSASDGLGT